MTEPEIHTVELRVNGDRVRLVAEPRTTLARALREDQGLTGTKLGCEQGVCGACTVVVDSKQLRSCLLFAVQAQDADVWTIEGLAADPADEADESAGGADAEQPLTTLPALAAAFRRHHALQCGFCTPGMLVAGAALGESGGCTSQDAIRQGLSGNVCRCTGYQGIVAALEETYGSGCASGPCGVAAASGDVPATEAAS